MPIGDPGRFEIRVAHSGMVTHKADRIAPKARDTTRLHGLAASAETFSPARPDPLQLVASG